MTDTKTGTRITQVATVMVPVSDQDRAIDQDRPVDQTRAQIRLDSAPRRMVDLAVASVLLLLACPLLLAAAVAVKLTSRGPVLYRQVRAGKDSRPFTVLKFRSMVSGADRTGPLVTDAHDPRVTKVGAVLRASKLDELPQLVNVVKGDMTLIGPRPEVPRFLPAYQAEELQLLRVRPGLTGPGQISYTQWSTPDDETTDPESFYLQVQLHPKLAMDLDYLRSRSLRTDVTTLTRTVALVCHLDRSRPARQLEPELQARPERRPGPERCEPELH